MQNTIIFIRHNHVEITVSSSQFMHFIGLFTMPEVWPAGVLIRRYYKPRNNYEE